MDIIEKIISNFKNNKSLKLNILFASLFFIVQTKEDLFPGSGKIANGPEGRKI